MFVGRAKRDIGLSFVGVARVTDREARRAATAHNRVVGPDFQWRPTGSDAVTGQWLYSDTRTPNRPDLADEWTGQTLTRPRRPAAIGTTTRTHLDWFAALQGRRRRLSRRHRFRAAGRLSRSVRRRRLDVQADRLRLAPAHVRQRRSPGRSIAAAADHAATCRPASAWTRRWNGFMQFRYIDEHDARRRRADRPAAVRLLSRSSARRGWLVADRVDGTLGQEIDFENARPATARRSTSARR